MYIEKNPTHKIVGVGFDYQALTYDSINFKEVFDKAREMRLKIILHTGEIKATLQNADDAINTLEVDIMGYRHLIIKDKNLIEEAKKSNLNLTMCPKSNEPLNDIPHYRNPIIDLSKQGLNVSKNSNYPAHFSSINDNYAKLADANNLRIDDLKILAQNSIKASLMDEKWKNKQIASIINYTEKFRKKFYFRLQEPYLSYA